MVILDKFNANLNILRNFWYFYINYWKILLILGNIEGGSCLPCPACLCTCTVGMAMSITCQLDSYVRGVKLKREACGQICMFISECMSVKIKSSIVPLYYICGSIFLNKNNRYATDPEITLPIKSNFMTCLLFSSIL